MLKDIDEKKDLKRARRQKRKRVLIKLDLAKEQDSSYSNRNLLLKMKDK